MRRGCGQGEKTWELAVWNIFDIVWKIKIAGNLGNSTYFSNHSQIRKWVLSMKYFILKKEIEEIMFQNPCHFVISSGTHFINIQTSRPSLYPISQSDMSAMFGMEKRRTIYQINTSRCEDTIILQGHSVRTFSVRGL